MQFTLQDKLSFSVLSGHAIVNALEIIHQPSGITGSMTYNNEIFLLLKKNK